MKKLQITLTAFFMILSCFTAQAQVDNGADSVQTDNGELRINPVLHGSIVFEWNGMNIFMDPYGGADRYEDFGNPGLVLITHLHDDHFNLETLSGLNTANTVFIAPQSVAEQMPAVFRDKTVVLANGDSHDINGMSVLAVPMYNLPEAGARHAKGWGNGYVLSIGGKSVYVSGDTEDIPEMRSLMGIDIAFVCMNLPYTMDINQAASAVLEFTPAIVYPYHHRGQDIHQFKALVDAGNKGTEVRLKNWYPGN